MKRVTVYEVIELIAAGLREHGHDVRIDEYRNLIVDGRPLRDPNAGPGVSWLMVVQSGPPGPQYPNVVVYHADEMSLAATDPHEKTISIMVYDKSGVGAVVDAVIDQIERRAARWALRWEPVTGRRHDQFVDLPDRGGRLHIRLEYRVKRWEGELRLNGSQVFASSNTEAAKVVTFLKTKADEIAAVRRELRSAVVECIRCGIENDPDLMKMSDAEVAADLKTYASELENVPADLIEPIVAAYRAGV